MTAQDCWGIVSGQIADSRSIAPAVSMLHQANYNHIVITIPEYSVNLVHNSAFL